MEHRGLRCYTKVVLSILQQKARILRGLDAIQKVALSILQQEARILRGLENTTVKQKFHYSVISW